MLNRKLVANSFLLASALLLVQGTIYLYQLSAATFLPASTFYDIRLVESAASVGALIISMGLPSIALVRMGITPPNQRRTLLVRMTLNSVGLTVIFGLSIAALKIGNLLPDGIKSQTPSIVLLSSLMAFRLLMTAAVQSQEGFKTLAISSMISTLCSILVLYLSHALGFDVFSTWFTARIALELSSITFLSVPLLKRADQNAYPSQIEADRFSSSWLLLAAGPVGISLFARSLIEHGPILWLAFIEASEIVAAEVGLLVTIIGVSIIPSRIVQGTLVPRLARELKNGLVAKGLVGVCALALLGSGFLFVGLIYIAGETSNWSMLSTSPIIMYGGLVILTAKVSASAMGAWLLILGRWNLILAINTLTLAIAATAAYLLVDSSASATTCILTLLGIEVVGAIFYILCSVFARSMNK